MDFCDFESNYCRYLRGKKRFDSVLGDIYKEDSTLGRMPPAVLMAPVDTRSSLELMLELIQKRDELPKDAPPALPSRPISRGRLPSSRKSLPLPLNFKTRSISPEPSMNEDSDKMETKGEPIVKVDKEFSVQNRFFESHDKLKKVDLSEDSSSYVNKPQAEISDEKNSGEIGRLIYQMSGSEKVVDKILMKVAIFCRIHIISFYWSYCFLQISNLDMVLCLPENEVIEI